MNEILRDLLLNGFMIYPSNGKFMVKKESVPTNTLVIQESAYDTYDLAVEAAEKMLHTPLELGWTVIARYNRGLGIEYKNLPDVRATTKQEAKELAEKLAEQLLAGPDIVLAEVQVRPKN